MRTYVSDDFSAYADGPLPTVSSGLYATPSHVSFHPLAVASHLVKGTVSGENETYLPSFAGSLTEHWAQITVGTYDQFMGPTVLNNGIGDFYYLDVQNTGWTFMLIKNGTFNQLSTVQPLTVVSGDVLRLEGHVLGGYAVVLIAYRNGVQLGVVDDSADAQKLTAPGTPGFRQWNTVSRVSKFEAGDFSTAPSGGSGGGGAPLTRLGETFG